MKKIAGKLVSVNNDDLIILKENPSEFWLGIKKIDSFAFKDATSLTEIEIPEGVTHIGQLVFPKGLKNIKFPSTVVEISSIALSSESELESIEIADGMSDISVFGYILGEAKSLKIPGSAKLTDSVLALSTNLETIELGEGITEIGNLFFANCSSLKEVKLPSSLKEIGKESFLECSNLEKIEIPEGVTVIGEDAFIHCKKLKEIKLPSTLVSVPTGAFKYCKALEKIEISHGIRHIGERIFYNCGKLKEIELPSTIEEIDEKAFYGCSSIEKISLQEGIKRINKYTFQGCKSLKEITLPSTIDFIGAHAFNGCENLETISIPKNVRIIEDGAFVNCKSLKEIKLPSSIECIGVGAFRNCTQLRRAEMPVGTKVERTIFEGCNNLEEIKIGPLTITGKLCQSQLLEYVMCLNTDLDSLKRSIHRSEQLIRQGIELPAKLIFDNPNNAEKFLFHKEYRFMKNLVNKMDESDKASNLFDLYKLANVMGVMENDGVTINIRGKQIPVNAVAYEVLQKAINDNQIDLSSMHMLFQSLPVGEYNEEFLKFMANKANLQELMAKNNAQPGFAARVYTWFEERKNRELSESQEPNRYKIKHYSTANSGIDKIKFSSPTVELFSKEFAADKFTGVTDARSQELAEYMGSFGLYEQKHYDKALEIDAERIESQVRDHINEEEIREDIIDSLEDYKKRTESLKNNIIDQSSEVIKTQTDTASKIFTYEMLAKSSKENFCIGFLTSCCATLYGAGAGAQRAMIIHPDMQPLVIRNIKGDIVAFGIMYVNREEGYAVVNDFEVNKNYDSDEIRKEIYTKAIQGVEKFASVYNKENPNKPIRKITSGLSPNWEAINNFIQKHPKSEILKAPNLDDFKYAGSGSWSGDWHNEQYTIWENKNNVR